MFTEILRVRDADKLTMYSGRLKKINVKCRAYFYNKLMTYENVIFIVIRFILKIVSALGMIGMYYVPYILRSDCFKYANFNAVTFSQ